MFSQAGTGSQSSQQSSSELFSQPRISQSKTSTHDNTSVPAYNSVQGEESSEKYYLKYISKPPLFPGQSKNERTKAEDFREFMETQQKITFEREQRDTFEGLIALLKDCTSEVTNAMSYFKETLSKNMEENLDQVTSAADKSVKVIMQLKADFAENFNTLKRNVREDQAVQETISKLEKQVAIKEETIKHLTFQLEELHAKEQRALEREESYFKREKEILEQLKTAESTSTPRKLNDIKELTRQLEESRKRESMALEREQKYVERENQLSASLKALENKQHYLPNNAIAEKHFHAHLPVNASTTHGGKMLTYGPTMPLVHYQQPRDQHNASHVTQRQDAIPPHCESDCFSARALTVSSHQVHSTSHPTAAIAPVQTMPMTQSLALPTEQHSNANSHATASFVTNKASVLPVSTASQRLQENHNQSNLISPGNLSASRASLHEYPKRSPVATVLPLTQVKIENNRKDCIFSKKGDDPLGIFVFDLTVPSPEKCNNSEMSAEMQSSETHVSPDKVPVVRAYATRSAHNKDTEAHPNTGIVKHASPSSHVQQPIKRRVSNRGNEDKKAEKRTRIEEDTQTAEPEAIVKNQPFRRKGFEAQRTLNIPFERLDEDVNINQITDSIRKHAMKRKQKVGQRKPYR
ncbi:predicted protein [Nematostella vectensis]|uniref:Uncharacterized protein n=1 Tax=Nematostella vectensis TaxID=45351 RepID=A7S151_NEMVE|nr:predicted protein [Nematostella vectensis]|eukprot:XP_001634597.1 predicted protein [Nematostella vectensis]